MELIKETVFEENIIMETKEEQKDNFSLKNLKHRFTSKSPDFFIKIRNVAIALGAAGAAIIAIPASVIILPTTITTIAGYCIAIGAVGTAISSATKE